MKQTLGAITEERTDPRKFRKAHKCTLSLVIGKTHTEGICDTGASGGNCIDQSVFSALPPGSYRYVSRVPSVCVGINKIPVKIVAKVMLHFHMIDDQQRHLNFSEEFNIIENLIHPIVIGLPFLQKHGAIMSFEKETLFVKGGEFPLGRASYRSSVPPPHLAMFEEIKIPPLSRANVNTYLAGDQAKFEKGKTKSLYVRPFFAECSRDVPHMVPHAVVDPNRRLIPLEIINVCFKIS